MGNSQNIEETVSRFIEKNSLLDKDSKLLVAVSGGADSVCLLTMLIKMGYDCEAVHCNFHLRGKESQRDEDFVVELCDKEGVKLHLRGFNTAQYSTRHGISIEMACRTLRYAYFNELIASEGAQGIAVAHHRDDNAETLLLNLVRGTGLRGARGIQPKNGNVIRPFLCISRDDILKYLERNGQDYVTDSSNKRDIFSRNKIRLDVMPLLTSINLSASANIATSIENFNEAYKVYAKAIEADIQKCVTAVGNTKVVNIEELSRCVSPISVIHEVLNPLGFSNSQEDDIIRSMTNGSGKMFSAKQWRLLVDRSQLIIAPIQQEDDVVKKFRFASHEGTVKVEGYGTITYKIKEKGGTTFNPDKRFAYFDIDKMHGPLTIRSVKSGDSFSPFGLRGKKLLSDFMTDRKFTRFEKETQKVMCDGDDIAWVIGERSSEKFKVDDNTSNVLTVYFEAEIATEPQD